jgi:hypothetical protein
MANKGLDDLRIAYGKLKRAGLAPKESWAFYRDHPNKRAPLLGAITRFHHVLTGKEHAVKVTDAQLKKLRSRYGKELTVHKGRVILSIRDKIRNGTIVPISELGIYSPIKIGPEVKNWEARIHAAFAKKKPGQMLGFRFSNYARYMWYFGDAETMIGKLQEYIDEMEEDQIEEVFVFTDKDWNTHRIARKIEKTPSSAELKRRRRKSYQKYYERNNVRINDRRRKRDAAKRGK